MQGQKAAMLPQQAAMFNFSQANINAQLRDFAKEIQARSSIVSNGSGIPKPEQKKTDSFIQFNPFN